MTKAIYDLAIASDDGDDKYFIRLLEEEAQKHGLSTYVIMSFNLKETIAKFKNQEISFNFFIDRASNTTADFLELYNLIMKNNIHVLDKNENLLWSQDKATMHLEFISNGIITPYTIIMSPYNQKNDISGLISDIDKIGKPFIIKPATITGGGEGVINNAETVMDIIHARKWHKTDKYLLQEKVIPQEIDGKKFWFRGFYIYTDVISLWWNDFTHVYDILLENEVERYNLKKINEIVLKIAEITKLNFFSTEIALNERNEFVVVDYVNETCDMRPKSIFFDGVPDEIVNFIVKKIIENVKRVINGSIS